MYHTGGIQSEAERRKQDASFKSCLCTGYGTRRKQGKLKRYTIKNLKMLVTTIFVGGFLNLGEGRQ